MKTIKTRGKMKSADTAEFRQKLKAARVLQRVRTLDARERPRDEQKRWRKQTKRHIERNGIKVIDAGKLRG